MFDFLSQVQSDELAEMMYYFEEVEGVHKDTDNDEDEEDED